MERRKFLLGTASTAIGASALIGSSAFNVARADRDMTVDIVGDEVAYLGLESTSAYSEIPDGENQLRIAFDGSIDGQNGEGLSENANYVFTDVFAIQNNGTDNIRVQLSETLDAIDWDTTYPIAYFTHEELGTTNDTTGDGNFIDSPGYADVAVGENLYVHFEFVGREASSRYDSDDVANPPENIGVYAEAID